MSQTLICPLCHARVGKGPMRAHVASSRCLATMQSSKHPPTLAQRKLIEKARALDETIGEMCTEQSARARRTLAGVMAAPEVG